MKISIHFLTNYKKLTATFVSIMIVILWLSRWLTTKSLHFRPLTETDKDLSSSIYMLVDVSLRKFLHYSIKGKSTHPYKI